MADNTALADELESQGTRWVSADTYAAAIAALRGEEPGTSTASPAAPSADELRDALEKISRTRSLDRAHEIAAEALAEPEEEEEPEPDDVEDDDGAEAEATTENG